MITSDGVALAVRVSGSPDGRPTLQLSGGPGAVNYLPDAPDGAGVRLHSPDPRGVGGSGGGPHDIGTALTDLEEVRRDAGVERWAAVVGHSFGADLALAYAVEHPDSVSRVVSVCGTGVQNDRDWARYYEQLHETHPEVSVHYDTAVHRALRFSWRMWIKEPDLLARLSRLPVPVTFVLAERDIRPSWPVRQLAALLPDTRLAELPGVGHDFWHTHPDVWQQLVADVEPARG